MARKGGKGREEPVIIGRSIDFLGYVFSRENVRLRKTVKHNFAVKIVQTKNETKLKQVKASYWGWCKWGNCRHLWRVITNNDMSFAEKGIRATKKTRDGKKYFSAKNVAITDVLNVPVTVVDFEAGIKTSKGDDRYHGYGTRSIRSIVEKYRGSMTIKADDGWYRLRVLFPLDE